MSSEVCKLLGYQLRVSFRKLAGGWEPARREAFLLRPDIATPASADIVAWPECLDIETASRLFSDFSAIPFSAPNGLGVYRLRDYVGANDAVLADDCTLIGLGVEKSAFDYLRRARDIEAGVEMPALYEDLGFDVCDEWLLSVLVNCGVESEIRASLRQDFAGQLNGYGLFGAIADARTFANRMATIAASHGPCYPISIIKVPQTRKAGL